MHNTDKTLTFIGEIVQPLCCICEEGLRKFEPCCIPDCKNRICIAHLDLGQASKLCAPNVTSGTWTCPVHNGVCNIIANNANRTMDIRILEFTDMVSITEPIISVCNSYFVSILYFQYIILSDMK